MPIAVIQFPDIDPTLVQIGPIAIRWYALAYIAGLVLGWLYMRSLIAKTWLWFKPDTGIPIASKTHTDDFLVWATLGVLVGGRLGFVVFYQLIKHPEDLIANPLSAFYVWQGGMNFHGGLIGVILAIILFCRKHRIDMLRFGDAICCATPFGLGFGRIANFINGEIWGKVSTAPWAVIPCNDRIRATYGHCPYGEEPRLPVQLYEAFLEGLVLFAILFVATRVYKGLQRPGLASGLFITLYAVFRIFVEVMYRDSDNKLGGGWTLGIVLSLPMLAIGPLLLWYAFHDRLGKPPFAAIVARLIGGAPKVAAAPSADAKAAPEQK